MHEHQHKSNTFDFRLHLSMLKHKSISHKNNIYYVLVDTLKVILNIESWWTKIYKSNLISIFSFTLTLDLNCLKEAHLLLNLLDFYDTISFACFAQKWNPFLSSNHKFIFFHIFSYFCRHFKCKKKNFVRDLYQINYNKHDQRDCSINIICLKVSLCYFLRKRL